MSAPWIAAVVGLWIMVLFEALLLFFLYHQFGLTLLGRYEAVARDGPPLKSTLPSMVFSTYGGVPYDLLGSLTGDFILLAFISRHCQPCAALAPDLNRMAHHYLGTVAVHAVIEESPAAAAETMSDLGVQVVGLANRDAFDVFEVRVTPFVIIADAAGIIRAKGLANNLSGLERLLRDARGVDGPSIAVDHYHPETESRTDTVLTEQARR